IVQICQDEQRRHAHALRAQRQAGKEHWEAAPGDVDRLFDQAAISKLAELSNLKRNIEKAEPANRAQALARFGAGIRIGVQRYLEAKAAPPLAIKKQILVLSDALNHAHTSNELPNQGGRRGDREAKRLAELIEALSAPSREWLMWTREPDIQIPTPEQIRNR